jgi:hypothetical protein
LEPHGTTGRANSLNRQNPFTICICFGVRHSASNKRGLAATIAIPPDPIDPVRDLLVIGDRRSVASNGLCASGTSSASASPTLADRPRGTESPW